MKQLTSFLAAIITLLPQFSYALPQETIRVNLSSNGQEGNSDSIEPAISQDGRFVVFESAASNLVEGDTNGDNDIFLHDLFTKQTVRVSLDSNGNQVGTPNALSDSLIPTISTNGRFVAFSSWATNLVPDDQNDQQDVFIRNVQTGETTRVSITADGQEGDCGCFGGFSAWWSSISANGQHVAFASLFSLVSQDDGNWDIFVRDRYTFKTLRASVNSRGEGGNQNSHMPTISGSGRYVVFISSATNLVPDDTNGVDDIFIHDLTSRDTRRVSVTNTNLEANGFSTAPVISSDGRFSAFASAATNLVANDTNDRLDVFLKDLSNGEIRRVSISSSGSQANGHSGRRTFPTSTGEVSISQDGRYIAFSSDATNLISDDNNTVTDIFVHDAQTGETRRVSVDSFGGEGNDWSLQPRISADGGHVAFISAASNLVSDDSNGRLDIFVHNLRPLDIPQVSADFTWSPETPQVGEPIQFTDESDGSPHFWIWDLGDGSITAGQAPNPTHAYSAGGVKSVTMQVSNKFGSSDSITKQITVEDPNQCTISCSAQASLKIASVDEIISFTATASTSNCEGEFTYTFDPGDGTQSIIPDCSNSPFCIFFHKYLSEGTFEWSLTTTIDATSCTASDIIDIRPHSEFPSDLTIEQTASSPRITVGEEVTFFFTIRNEGPFDSLTTQTRDNLPDGLTYVSHRALPRDTGVSFCDVNSPQDLTCHTSSIRVGKEASFQIVARAERLGSYTNTVEVSSQRPDPEPANNSASVTIEIDEPKTPVLIVPGILGSQELEKDKWALEKVLSVVGLRKGAYTELYEGLAALGYKPVGNVQARWLSEQNKWQADENVSNPTLFPAPYDWRLPNAETAKKFLKKQIDRAKQLSGAEKVDLVAHSMGGIVARAYIQSPEYAWDIRRLVLLGTPNHGSVNAYFAWEGGEPAPGESAEITVYKWLKLRWPWLTSASHQNLTTFIQNNIPSIGELLPTESYLKHCERAIFPFSTCVPGTISQDAIPYTNLTEQGQNSFLRLLNESLKEPTRTFPRNIEVLLIPGTTPPNPEQKIGTPVFATVGEPTELDRRYNKWNDGAPLTPKVEYAIGDGTVTLGSALLPELPNGLIEVTQLPTNIVHDHQALPTLSIQPVVDFICPDCPSDGAPTVLRNRQQSEADASLGFLLACSTAAEGAIMVVDPLGRRLGTDLSPQREFSEIPDAFYSDPDEEERLVLINAPIAGEFQIKITANNTDHCILGGVYTNKERQAEFQSQIRVQARMPQAFNIILEPGETHPLNHSLPPRITSFSHDVVLSGQQITVTGRGFLADGLKVLFGNHVAADVEVINDEILLVTIPPDVPSGPTPLTIRTHGGTVTLRDPLITIESATIFPQLALGGGFQAIVMLSNSTTTQWTGEATLYQGDELPWMARWALNGADMTGSSRFNVSIDGNATEKFVLTGDSDLQVGYLKLSARNGQFGSDVSVSFFFNLFLNNALIDSTGVPPQPPNTAFTFPVETTSSVDTGLALISTAAEPFSMAFSLFDRQGVLVQRISRRYDGHFARFFTEIFSNIPNNFLGKLKVESEKSIYLVVLRLELTDLGFQLTSTTPGTQ